MHALQIILFVSGCKIAQIIKQEHKIEANRQAQPQSISIQSLKNK